ncbi:hypothetical protein GGX14DRAFT_615698 [Mycena pura]|uniref:RRM domain-containing protein n=1 Tax=Mycena pura TaxID=153505 RepID=A0AAD6YTL8_9AGAR|nr:hypothetical protein GGX14DRAFT_615698 [Mycena pura]
MSTKGRSLSPQNQDADMDVDGKPANKSAARVVVITNLTRSVAEIHLKTIFGFYGEVVRVDFPVFSKSGQNRGKAALEYADAPSAARAVSHMNGGQIDGAVVKVELSDLPVRSRSRSRPPRPRSFSRSRSRSRSRSPPGYRRRGPGGPAPRARDVYRGRPFRRGGPPGRDFYRPGMSRSRSRSRSPIRRGPQDRLGPRRRSPSYSRGGYGRTRRSMSRGRSVRSSRSRSRTRSMSRSRSRSRSSYSSYSRYSRSRSRTRSRSVSRGKRSMSDIRDSRSRSRSRG